MRDTGIVRRIDDLGRIVIPMELRKTLGIHVKDPLEIYVEGDRIILQRQHNSCAICGADEENMVLIKERAVCSECVSKIRQG